MCQELGEVPRWQGKLFFFTHSAKLARQVKNPKRYCIYIGLFFVIVHLRAGGFAHWRSRG
jgi:hypothetical protein